MSQTIIFVGDLHLKSQSPICRRDLFPTAILNKIEYIASLAKSYNCKTIMLLGDVFDSPVTTLPYLASVINTFKKVHDAGITVYTIVGNHDIKHNLMSNLPTSALGILISTGYVQLAPSEFKIKNTTFKCFNYPEKLTPKSSDEYEMCVAHQYYKFAVADDNLTEDDVKKLNYDAMILGHLHVPCDTEIVGNTTIYRPGSLSRNTSEPYNKLRIPRVLVYNCSNHKAIYAEVSCAAAEDVFVENIEANNQETLSMKDLINFITTSYQSTDMNVRDYFCKINIPIDCRQKIAGYLDSIGA